ncbi:hypothetical protein Tco_0732575 [Tanacetum coccineum]
MKDFNNRVIFFQWKSVKEEIHEDWEGEPKDVAEALEKTSQHETEGDLKKFVADTEMHSDTNFRLFVHRRVVTSTLHSHSPFRRVKILASTIARTSMSF